MELVITADRSDEALFVRAKGEVDLGTVDQLDSALDAACEEVSPPMAVVVDLRGVTFLASSGLSALVRAHERCSGAGTPLRVIAGNRAVLRGFEVTGLDKVIDLRESE